MNFINSLNGKRLCLLLPAVLMTLAPLALPAQERTIYDLLSDQGVTEVTLEIDLDSVLANRRNEDRVTGFFEFSDPSGRPYRWSVEVNVRGRFRRTKCDFPPLKINFGKKQLREAGLETHNNLKLVTHCLDTWQGEDILLREYLVYKIYRTLTDASYRTHLVKVRYKDTGNRKPFTAFGILIEDEKEMADRLGGELCTDCYNLLPDSFDLDQAALLDLFQYMVGNVDYSPKVLRNLELLRPDEGGKYLLIPYDFDFSGLVNAPYAAPPPSLGILTVRERVYLGFSYERRHLEKAFADLQAHREEILDVVRNDPHLSSASRKDILRYLETFFRQMEREAPEFGSLTAGRE